jgi:hypothetical protein
MLMVLYFKAERPTRGKRHLPLATLPLTYIYVKNLTKSHIRPVLTAERNGYHLPPENRNSFKDCLTYNTK